MLMALEIKNFAIIDELRVEFQFGLNVLTGETGAGKSIIIDAVNLLLGGRASTDFIRSGADKAVVAGIFSVNQVIQEIISELGLEPEEDDILLLQRELADNGPNLCRINGKQVTLSMYRQIGTKLIDISGQHEHQSLMEKQKHIEIVDLLAGEPAVIKKNDLSQIYKQLVMVLEKISSFEENQQENLQKLDLWNFQLNEIREADLYADEEEQLKKEKKILASGEQLLINSRGAYEVLNGSAGANARDLLVQAGSQLENIKEVDERLISLFKTIESCLYQIEDVAEELRVYTDGVVFDPDRLEEIENRLARLNMLKRKYGTDISEIINYAEKLAIKINEIENLDDIVVNLDNERKKLEENYLAVASDLTAIRKTTIKKFIKQVTRELTELEMNNTSFRVEISQTTKFSYNGLDKLEFTLSSNQGEPLKSLQKIASGGELSRIMLALKTIIASLDNVPTLIFDEIDTGIGGRAVQAVAEKLKQIGENRQVICVTHSPQIAGQANIHFHLDKTIKQGRVTTKIQLLSYEERVEEIARMLTGNKITATTLQQAKEILQK